MKQELTKKIVRVGNSAGVILPREWLNGKARIELISKPLNIKKDVIEILENYLEYIIGIYIVGSYARGEETEQSDIDILVITNDISKKITEGKYNIILVQKSKLEEYLKRNIMPFLPMLIEAKPILNGELLDKLKKVQLTKDNLRGHLEIVKSGLAVNKEFIKLDKELDEDASDANSYSLVLHLRSVYIVDCLIKNKLWSTNGLLSLIKKITGSVRVYGGYLRVKNDKKEREELPLEEAEKLYNYILMRIREQERWLKAKRE